MEKNFESMVLPVSIAHFLLLFLLAQLDLYERWREDRPVLLLDDLDSELDQAKNPLLLSRNSKTAIKR